MPRSNSGRRTRPASPFSSRFARKETQVSPLAWVGIAGGTLVVLVAALMLRGLGQISPWILGTGAFVLAPPLVRGGYSFLRDDELEPYRGTTLMIRVLVCSLVYAILWGVYAWLPSIALSLDQLELFHLTADSASDPVVGRSRRWPPWTSISATRRFTMPSTCS